MKTRTDDIEDFYNKIRAKDKTIKVLMDRVEQSFNTGTDTFSMMQSNIELERKVEERTRNLELQTEKMKLLAIEADQANKAKSEFLANMSHEIRTPMHAILGYIDLLKEKPHDKEAEEYLEIISSSSKHLLGIINDILDYSKAEAGKVTLDPQKYNLKAEVIELTKLFEVTCQDKGIKFSLKLDPYIPDWIMVDGFRLKQILNNLISNAIKFTEKEKSVHLKIVRHPETLEFLVEDEGIGMSEDVLENIFSAFTQAESSTTRNYGGTGLGLAISSKLVELLGGKIKVSSQVNIGSTFSFHLPLVEVGAPKKKQISKEAPKTKELFRVLIVEDNPTNQKLISAYLSRLDYEYEIVNNGQECLDILEEKNFDLILMDENMPILNGIAATQEIRRREKGKSRKNIIVALTANAMEGDKERFINAGMDEYLSKPVSKNVLGKMLKQFLG